jgi:MSHA biogenesis protein MshO
MNMRQQGFTLIELIVALTISALVVGFVATFIGVPVRAQQAQTRRAELAASAEAVTHWMSQDVRGALPNSIRTGMVAGRPVVEVIDFTSVARYRDQGPEGDFLQINPLLPPDPTFDVLGAPGDGNIHAVVNNLGVAGQNAYAMANAALNVIAPATINASTVTLNNPAFRFVAHSPNFRVYLVTPATAVVRYECDLVARELRRYDNRPIAAGIAAMPAGTPFRTIARDVTACTFARRPGNTENGGMLLMQVTVSRVTNGAADSLRIMKQLKVEDAA